MNYPLIRKGAPAASRFRSLFTPALFLLLLVAFAVWYPTALQSAAQAAARPLFQARSFAGRILSDMFAYFSSVQSLADERDRMRDELLRARSLLADRELLLFENQELKEKLSRAVLRKRVVGAILSVPPHSAYDTAVLDAGIEDGVAAGDRVYAGSVIVGRISKSFARSSLVEFFSSPARETPVFILNQGVSIPATAVGAGGGVFKVMLPGGASVAVGDSVSIAGMPPTPLGRVGAIEEGSADSFKAVYIISAAQVSRQRYLEIEPGGSPDMP